MEWEEKEGRGVCAWRRAATEQREIGEEGDEGELVVRMGKDGLGKRTLQVSA